MRLELLSNPLLLLERAGQVAASRLRLRRLRGTPARFLDVGHVDSLELLELLRPEAPKIIYDIGANVGTWTLLAKAVFPVAEVQAFEPLKKHVAGFKKNTDALKDVHLHQTALGPTKGNQALQIASFSDASSLLEIGARMHEQYQIQKSGEEIVPVERLDDYVLRHNLPPPDLIKLDVQGYELEVLRGGLDCLHRARAVITEVSFVEYYSKQCLFADVVEFMARQNFRLHSLGLGTALGKPLTQTDVLFRRGVSRKVQ